MASLKASAVPACISQPLNLALFLLLLFVHGWQINATNVAIADEPGYNSNNTSGAVIAPRIVGGQIVAPRTFRWYAVSTINLLCGGTLIHDDIILTAAHCVDAFRPGYQVMIGTTRRGSGRESDTQYRTIVTAVQHPLYSSFSYRFDFMLLKLNNPVFNFAPIRLNRERYFPPVNDDWTTVIGFGRTTEGGGLSNELRSVDVEILPHGQCQGQYDADIVDEVMVCAMFSGGGRDSCQGDSGGPLFKWWNGEYVQIGVVSWGYGCARPTHAGVYARVSAAMAWIDPEICNLSIIKPASCFPTPQPTPRPTPSPTNPPTNHPTNRPTIRPTNHPTLRPTNHPTPRPTNHPTPRPTNRPTPQPSLRPTLRPTRRPSPLPTNSPSASPTELQTTTDIRLVLNYGKSDQVRYWEIRKINGNGSGGPKMFTGPTASKRPRSAETILLRDVPFGVYEISVFDTSLDGSTDAFRIFQSIRGQTDLCLFRTPGNFFYREDVRFVVSRDGVATGSCATRAPTALPTAAPTSEPSVGPTQSPSVTPTAKPSMSPTHFPTGSPFGTGTSSPTVTTTLPPSVSPTMSPTMAPTALPGPAPGHELLKITVRYDESPLDTRWSVQEGWTDIIKGPQPSFVPEPFDEEVRYWLAPHGDYSFRIIDRAFNGVSRSDFLSIVQILGDGSEEEIAYSDKAFAFYGFITDFSVYPRSPPPPTTTLMIVISFGGDRSVPREWKLESLDNDETLYHAPYFVPSEDSTTRLQENITLGTYKVTISDSNLLSQDYLHVYQVLADGTRVDIAEGPPVAFTGSYESTFILDSVDGPSPVRASLAPTSGPTMAPSASPSSTPSSAALATQSPTIAPTVTPTASPTASPSTAPSVPPSTPPTEPSEAVQTPTPTDSPTFAPTQVPTASPFDTQTSARIKFVVRYDGKPSETRWSIRSGYYDIYSGPPAGTTPEAFSEEAHFWTVPYGAFQVRVTDKAFDGISRNDFFSLFRVHGDGTEIPILQSSDTFTGAVGFQSYGFAQDFTLQPL